jgi:hypothetical protein
MGNWRYMWLKEWSASRFGRFSRGEYPQVAIVLRGLFLEGREKRDIPLSCRESNSDSSVVQYVA